MTQVLTISMHGGTDDGPPIRIDFSTNSHPLGPNPVVRAAVECADRTRYPDPQYKSLRSALGDFHEVSPERIVVGASASELIWRLTRFWSEAGDSGVLTDDRTFGEYLRAARELNVPVTADRSVWVASTSVLHWYCNPDNPSGVNRSEEISRALDGSRARSSHCDLIVVDLAYWPFRWLLDAEAQPEVLTAPWADDIVQLWSPNKLHGLTGARGAYLVLPKKVHPRATLERLTALAPSWVLGADGVALLRAHVSPDSLCYLRDTASTLRVWKHTQDRRLQEAGWQSQPSPLHYGLWQPPVMQSSQPQWHARLREKGIKLRDAASFGRLGWVRLVSRSPDEVQQLLVETDPFRGDP
jgi:histidinol-phosphate aminotransferase